MNHPIKQANMLDLAKHQKSLYSHPRLHFLFLELTDKCNLNCLHCGSKCTGNNNTYLDYGVIEKTLRTVAKCYDPAGIMICITGGEPLLYPDIFRIVGMSRTLGFSVGITSNGTLIREREAHLLKRAGLNTIAISLDGLQDKHDRFRCSEGAFDSSMRGIKLQELLIWMTLSREQKTLEFMKKLRITYKVF